MTNALHLYNVALSNQTDKRKIKTARFPLLIEAATLPSSLQYPEPLIANFNRINIHFTLSIK